MEAEHNDYEQVANKPSDNLSEPDLTDDVEMSIDDDDDDENEEKEDLDEDDDEDVDEDEDEDVDEDEEEEELVKLDQRGPEHERGVRGEINAICGPLDIRFILDGPRDYDLRPLNKFFHREWAEAEHIFKSVMDYEEIYRYGESPCSSPSPSGLGL